MPNFANSVPYATHEPASLRDSLNALIAALSSDEREAAPEPTDGQTVLPAVDDEDYLAATRRALIRGGIGTE